jgi:hypothetical protein
VRLSQGCRLYTSTHQRHDEIRDLFGQLATEISHVEIEPAVLHLTGEKLHTTANGKDDHGFSIISLFDNSFAIRLTISDNQENLIILFGVG